MIPKIIDVIEGKEIKSSADNKVVVDIIDFLSADGKTPGFLSVYVGNDAPPHLAYKSQEESSFLIPHSIYIDFFLKNDIFIHVRLNGLRFSCAERTTN
jgi:hypothetical protein